jgi:hypothetical protein
VDLRYTSEYFFPLSNGCLERAALEGLHRGIELENSIMDVDYRLDHILRCGQNLWDWRTERDGREEKEEEWKVHHVGAYLVMTVVIDTTL